MERRATRAGAQSSSTPRAVIHAPIRRAPFKDRWKPDNGVGVTAPAPALWIAAGHANGHHVLRHHPAFLQVDHTDNHRASRIKGHVLKSPSPIELANLIIDRMGDDTEAPNVIRGAQSRGQCEEQKRACMTLTLIGPVDRELAEQCCRQRVRFIAAVLLGEKLAFDLSGAQRYVAHNQSRAGGTDYACARYA